jgi:long-chain acyl-CoA synthetase
MERIWLKSYPAGVPADVDVDAFRSIIDMSLKEWKRFQNIGRST